MNELPIDEFRNLHATISKLQVLAADLGDELHYRDLKIRSLERIRARLIDRLKEACVDMPTLEELAAPNPTAAARAEELSQHEFLHSELECLERCQWCVDAEARARLVGALEQAAAAHQRGDRPDRGGWWCDACGNSWPCHVRKTVDAALGDGRTTG